jgi:AcrR family transcriptional regulator
MKTSRGVGVHYQGDLRQEMIAAAAAALAEAGAEHVSLRDVARRVGVSHAAPAHHFGDKAGMLTAVAVQGFELFTGYLSAAAHGTGTPLDALPANGRAYMEFSDLYPGHFEVMFHPALLNTGDPAYQSAGDKAFQLLHDLVAACQQHGWHPDADTTALTASTWALFHGLALLRGQGSLTPHLPDTSPEALIDAARALTGLEPAGPPSAPPPSADAVHGSGIREA